MFDIDFGNDAPQTNELTSPLFENLRKEGIEPGFLTSEIFQDNKFCDSFLKDLPAEEQYQYLKNTCLFETKLKKDQWLRAAGQSDTMFGPEAEAPAVPKANGEIRPAETGQTIEIQNLREAGIDPSKILIFRATQPSETPKPELFWTTDYFETRKGLTVEMGESRETAIIMISNLEQVCAGGAIRDINDDHGLALRRVNPSPTDQRSALGIIRP